jgi:hypothetical protein
MNTFFQHLSDPEYMHVLLNPLPVYGLALGIVGLLLAVIARNRVAIVVALVPVFLSGLAAWPTYHYGEEAYDRVKSISDPAGEQWLDEHMARGEKLIYAFYLLAGLAVVAAVAPIKWPRSAMPLAATTLVLGFATLGIGGWISYPGGHVRHKEFRFEPPPVAKSAEHTHPHGGGEEAMSHGSMPGMEEKSGNAKEQPMPHPAAEQPAGPTQEQLEASRLQLEASQLQLEASRKQLEAADAAQAKTASPPPQQTQSPHAEDGHEHEPKP